MNLGLGKQVGGRLSSWSLCLFWKIVEKTSAFLDGSYVTEPSSVRIEGKEKFTHKKRKVLRVNHHLCGCIAVDSDLLILLLYSNNAAS